MAMRQYIALIHKDADSDYGVSFPDLPGVISAGSTLDEARDMAAEALALHLEGLAEDGEAVPEPSSLEEIMAIEENKDGVAVLVDAPADDIRSVRVNVTIPQNVLDQIDRYAEREGYSRSGLLVRAAKKIYADAAQPAVLKFADQTIRCLTLQEAVIARNSLVADWKAIATIAVPGRTYQPEEIDKLHHAKVA
jgi:predicted RNase H-like HicB family nuclease